MLDRKTLELCLNMYWRLISGENFHNHFREQRKAFDLLGALYSTWQFGKQRFLQQRSKQKFDNNFIKKAVKISAETADHKDYIVAYGDGSFPLLMAGMDGWSLAHGRLMVLLSKRVHIAISNEYRTTKAYPKCQNNKYYKQCPRGNCSSYNS